MSQTTNALSGAASGAATGATVGGPWGALIGGVAGGAIGLMAPTDDPYAAQREQLQQQLDYLHSIPAPTAQQLQVKAYLEKVMGSITPAQEVAQTLSKNDLAALQSNPELIQKQMDQLNLLNNIAKNGMTPAEEANQRQIINQLESSAASNNANIQREESQRGTASSGAGLLAKMIAQQQAQNSASSNTDKLMAEMFQNKLSASNQASNLANQLDQTQYNRASQIAQNQQAIDQFNAQMKAATQARNVGAENQAQYANLQNAQNVANNNINLQNQNQLYNAGVYEQLYNNQLAKSGLTSGATNALAQQLGQSGQRQNEFLSGLTQGVGTLAGYGAKAYNTPSPSPSGDGSGSMQNNGNSYLGVNTNFNESHAHGGMVGENSCYSNGGQVPGDSEKNDIIPIMASPGEAIIPKSIMENPNAGILSKHYVEGLLKKHREAFNKGGK